MGSADDRLGALLILFGTAAGSFAGYLHEQDNHGVPWGELASGGAVIASGAMLSYRLSDPVPVCAAVLMAGAMIVAYELMSVDAEHEGGAK